MCPMCSKYLDIHSGGVPRSCRAPAPLSDALCLAPLRQIHGDFLPSARRHLLASPSDNLCCPSVSQENGLLPWPGTRFLICSTMNFYHWHFCGTFVADERIRRRAVRPVASSWTKIHQSPRTKRLGEPVQSLFRFEFIPGFFSFDNSGRPLAALNRVPP